MAQNVQLIVGRSYSLTFHIRENGVCGYTDMTGFASASQNDIFTFTHSPSNYGSISTWATFTYTFTAQVQNTVIQIGSTTYKGLCGPVLDDVSLYIKPSPAISASATQNIPITTITATATSFSSSVITTILPSDKEISLNNTRNETARMGNGDGSLKIESPISSPSLNSSSSESGHTTMPKYMISLLIAIGSIVLIASAGTLVYIFIYRKRKGDNLESNPESNRLKDYVSRSKFLVSNSSTLAHDLRSESSTVNTQSNNNLINYNNNSMPEEPISTITRHHDTTGNYTAHTYNVYALMQSNIDNHATSPPELRPNFEQYDLPSYADLEKATINSDEDEAQPIINLEKKPANMLSADDPVVKDDDTISTIIRSYDDYS